MKWAKISKAWEVTKLTSLMLLVFLTIYIPYLAALIYFFNYLIANGTDIIAASVVLSIMGLGGMLIVIAIMYKVTMVYVEIYDLETKFKTMNL